MNSPEERAPVLGTLAVVLLTAAWGYVRLSLWPELVLPLTFVVPMLICVWTRRTWHLWFMAAAFATIVVIKAFLVLPGAQLGPWERRAFAGATLFNIVIGGIVIHAIIRLRARLDERSAVLAARNAALEAQSREVVAQNEEIRAQSEELAQQNEEIEAQAEELTRQNEELQEIATRMTHREDVLQGLVEAARTPETGRLALAALARRALPILGEPAVALAVLKRDGDGLKIKVQAAIDGGPVVPEHWPVDGSIARVVLAENKTAYVSDLAGAPALAAPFPIDGVVRSLLVTPMPIAGVPSGIVVACAAKPGHWTQEQFRILEWIAAQCGLLAESLRWQGALAEHAREAEAANRAKDQFLAMLSHELRTPLTPVLAAAGVLEHDPRLPDDVLEDVAMIRRNISIQSRLIDDLLDLTRLGRGKLELDLQQLDLGTLLRETAQIVGPDLDAKGQKLLLDLDAAEHRVVRGDGPRLQQVFWNLLKNANKYSPAQTTIRLSAKLVEGDAGRVAIEVADEGIGIDAANVQRIFLPFEQVVTRDKNRSSVAGLGLGLAIAKAIVELHQGAIRVSSAGAGRGSQFTVELPIAVSAATRPSRLPSRPPFPDTPVPQPVLRILLVEDHVDTGRVLARLLTNSGYHVEHAKSAKAARECLAARTFDLLISDVGLPDESGIELMRAVRATHPDLIGICLSGFGMEQDLDACRAAGFAEHLTKPVDMQRLHAAIARNCAARLART